MYFETLDPRRYFDFTASYDPATDTINVVGSNVAESVVINYETGSEANLLFRNLLNSDNTYIFFLSSESPLAKISIQLNDGNDTVAIRDDTLSGTNASNFPFDMIVNAGKGNDSIATGAGKDSITAGEGNDVLSSGPNNDTLDGGGGTDQIAGGLGIDTCINTSRVSPLSLSLDGVANDGAAGENDNIQTSVENITGGQNNDTITGNDFGNVLAGGGGNDLIKGLKGNDVLIGSAGRDTMQGGEGDDLFFALEPGEVDSMNGGTGLDKASRDGSVVTDTFNQFGPPVEDICDPDIEIQTNGPDLAIYPTTGNDTISLSQSGSNLTITRNGASIITSITGVTRVAVAGGLGNDTISANASVVVPLLLNGNEGNDSITGGSANDSIKGGTGNDTLNGQNGNDTIDGGDGADRLIGGGGNDSMLGGNDNDTLIGNGGNDVYDGGAGTDTADYSGTSSNQRISLDDVANDGSAPLNEQDNVKSTVENILGGSGNDTLIGSALANDLRGGAGNDSILGLAGSDTIYGNSGRDFLSGGDNADTFFSADGEIDTVRGGNGADIDGSVDEIDDAIY